MSVSCPFKDPVAVNFSAEIRCVCCTDKYIYASYDDKLGRIECATAAGQSSMHLSNVKRIAALLTLSPQYEWVIVFVCDKKHALMVLREKDFGSEKAVVDTGIQDVECFATNCTDGELVVVLREKRRLQIIRVDSGTLQTHTLCDVKVDAAPVRQIVSCSSGTMMKCKGKLKYLQRDGSQGLDLDIPDAFDLTMVERNSAPGVRQTSVEFYAVFKNRISEIKVSADKDNLVDLPGFKDAGDILWFGVRYPFAYMFQNDKVVVYDWPVRESSVRVSLGKPTKYRDWCVLRNWGVVLARGKDLVVVQFQGDPSVAGDQMEKWIRNLFHRDEREAIMAASALGNKKLSSQLCFEYGVKLMRQGHFDKAFKEFELLDPEERTVRVVALFTEFVPEYAPTSVDDPILRIREQVESFGKIDQSIQVTEGAMTQLKLFLERSTSERLKSIVKSMLLECYAILGTKSEEHHRHMEKFIDENEAYILDSTLDFLKRYGKVDDLVRVIRHRSEQEAQKYFPTVYKEKGPDAAIMFYSSHLNRLEQVDRILQFLDTVECMKSQDKLEAQIIFLTACKERPQLASLFLDRKLMTLYIDFFGKFVVNAPERAGKYIRIQDEKETMRRWRTSFVDFLENTDSETFVDFAYQKLEDLMLLEELLVILRRRNRTEDALNLISKHQMPISTAIEYCQAMVPQNPRIFTQFFQKLASEKSEQRRNYCLELLKTKADQLVLSEVIPHIPPDVPLSEIRDFLRYITVDLENEVRQAKLEHALAECALRTRRSQIEILEKQRVLVAPLCQGCNKPITKDQAFCVTRFNLVFHPGCVPKQEVDIESLDISYDGNC